MSDTIDVCAVGALERARAPYLDFYLALNVACRLKNTVVGGRRLTSPNKITALVLNAFEYSRTLF